MKASLQDWLQLIREDRRLLIGLSLLLVLLIVTLAVWVQDQGLWEWNETPEIAYTTLAATGMTETSGAEQAGREAEAPASSERVPTTTDVLAVYLSGSVQRPGVYYMAPGALIDDLLRAAGGVLPEADLRRVNLAEPLRANSQIDIPAVGEAPVISNQPVQNPSADTATGSGSAKIDLNTAGVAELDQLPGIGERTAAAIIRFREQHGPFQRIEDLMKVPGIKESRFMSLKDLICVNGP